jgi:hypothetical protein
MPSTVKRIDLGGGQSRTSSQSKAEHGADRHSVDRVRRERVPHLFRIFSFGNAIRRSSPVRRIVCRYNEQVSADTVQVAGRKKETGVKPVHSAVGGVLEVGPRRLALVNEGAEPFKR